MHGHYSSGLQLEGELEVCLGDGGDAAIAIVREAIS
jgi:hypothetical protein